MRRSIMFVSVLALTALAATAEDRLNACRKANLAAVAAADSANEAKYRDAADMLVQPGVLANRKDKWVRIKAEVTMLSANDPAEFLLVPDNSGNDYEALAVAFAKPSAIHKALEFIGVKSGRPINGEKLRFWPKGERVFVSFEQGELPEQMYKQTSANLPARARRGVRAESLILDKRAGKTMPASGFVFTGSYWTDDPDGSGRKIYSADKFGPNPIIANYNDPATVLDIPCQLAQHQVYGQQYPNPEHLFVKGGPILLTLKPVNASSGRATTNMTLVVAAVEEHSISNSLRDLIFRYGDEKSTNFTEKTRMEDVISAFGTIVESGSDLALSVRLSAQFSIDLVRDVILGFAKSRKYAVVRVNPPLPGELIDVVMEPEYKDGKERVKDLTLHLLPRTQGTAPESMADVTCRLTDSAGATLSKGNELKDVLDVFEKLVADGHDPFVCVSYDGGLPLNAIRQVSTFLSGMDKVGGIRIDPPPAGHMYYKAFLPDEKMRDRTNRVVHPWEFRLTQKDGSLSGAVTLIDEVKNEKGDWKPRTRDFSASTPEAVKAVLTMKNDDGTKAGIPVVLVFAPRTLLYKSLVPFTSSMLETLPTIWVYLE